MTANELKIKLEDAEAKVEKRENTIKKLCNKLGIGFEVLMVSYDNQVAYKSESQDSFMRHQEAENIVKEVVTAKPERDENGNWLEDAYDFNSKISQLEDNLCKLYDVQRIANSWEEKYTVQFNKENATKIEVIWNFLTNWENMAREWYVKNAKTYFELKRDYNQAFEDFKKTDAYKKEFELCSKWYKHSVDYRVEESVEESFKKEYYAGIDSFTKNITTIKCKYVYKDNNHWDYDYVPDTYTVSMDLLNKTLAQEKLAKYFDLCNRISEVVGEITDASNLSIGNQHGEINGIVKGTKGSARVETISASGPVQCFHYRVLVHKIKQ